MDGRQVCSNQKKIMNDADLAAERLWNYSQNKLLEDYPDFERDLKLVLEELETTKQKFHDLQMKRVDEALNRLTKGENE